MLLLGKVVQMVAFLFARKHRITKSEESYSFQICRVSCSLFAALCGKAEDGTRRDSLVLLVLSARQHLDHKQCFC